MDKVYAQYKARVIEAMLGGYYLFKTLEQARQQLSIIRDQYYVSLHPAHVNTPDACVFWIRGWNLSEEDKAKGLLGSFAQVACVPRGKDFHFAITKLSDDAPHPQKRRPQTQHPNWGHPILRDVKKKKNYETIEAAHEQLIRLQQEYPKASVPGKYSLFVAIYGKNADKPGSRIVRYVLEIEPQKDGGYLIVPKEKKQKPKLKAKPKDAPKPKAAVKAKTPVAKPKALPSKKAEENPKKPVGFFTSKVILKRGDKKPK